MEINDITPLKLFLSVLSVLSPNTPIDIRTYKNPSKKKSLIITNTCIETQQLCINDGFKIINKNDCRFISSICVDSTALNDIIKDSNSNNPISFKYIPRDNKLRIELDGQIHTISNIYFFKILKKVNMSGNVFNIIDSDKFIIYLSSINLPICNIKFYENQQYVHTNINNSIVLREDKKSWYSVNNFEINLITNQLSLFNNLAVMSEYTELWFRLDYVIVNHRSKNWSVSFKVNNVVDEI